MVLMISLLSMPWRLEALMVAEVAELQLDVPAPAGVRLLPALPG
jgi:hypothetical protein